MDLFSAFSVKYMKVMNCEEYVSQDQILPFIESRCYYADVKEVKMYLNLPFKYKAFANVVNIGTKM